MTEQTYTTLADVEEAERLIRERAEQEAAEVAQARADLIKAADQARAEAARERLAELNEDLIPANHAREAEARTALAELIASGSNPLLEALATIAECHYATHALALEASSMAATVGVPGPQVPRQQALDLPQILAEAIDTEGKARTPEPVPLPEPGTPRLTHEEQGTAERVRRHEDRTLSEYTDLTEADIARLTAEQRTQKLAEADAERVRREQSVSAAHRAEELERRSSRVGFRKLLGP